VKIWRRVMIPDEEVILPAGLLGDPAEGEAEDVLVHLEGGRSHPEEGKEHRDGEKNEEAVAENLAQPLPAAHGSLGREVHR
jgi:hypothetical protein